MYTVQSIQGANLAGQELNIFAQILITNKEKK
jgi:hypothetical protein